MTPPRPASSRVGRPADLARQLAQGDVEPEPEGPSLLARRDLPSLIPGDTLSVRNDSKAPVEFAWNRRRWVVSPGQDKMVPFEAIVNVLGDPRSDDEPAMYDDGNGNAGQVVRRQDELSRLFARYGIEFEDKGELVRAVPTLLVRHPETDHTITFPAQDPTMIAYPVLNTQQRDMTGQRRAVDALQAENAELRANQDRLEKMMQEVLERQSQGLTED